MGCDIHIIIERQAESGQWHRLWQHSYDVPDLEGTPESFRNRNYDLFGILADVRNGVGFAGFATGTGWPSIAPNRGIPADSTVTPDDEREYRLGDHSFTWVALDELTAFYWDGTVAEAYGVVTREEYTRMKAANEDRPKQWCGGISGRDVRTVSEQDLMNAKGPIPFSHVSITWKETAREATGDWPTEILPWLAMLADGRPLRLVMGFDS